MVWMGIEHDGNDEWLAANGGLMTENHDWKWWWANGGGWWQMMG
jgi:hypothetical protein